MLVMAIYKDTLRTYPPLACATAGSRSISAHRLTERLISTALPGALALDGDPLETGATRTHT
jgi:hypothetical protein